MMSSNPFTNAVLDSRPAEPPVEPLACSAVLTHHWLVRLRGGEKVLQALCKLLPDSPIYTFLHDRIGVGPFPPRGNAGGAAPVEDGRHGDRPLPRWGTDSRRVVTSLLQHIPGAKRHYPKLLPLLPWAARLVRLPPVDLVVCSDAAIAKAMTPHPRSKLVCYCHSPMRYAWEQAIAREYRAALPLPLRPFWGLTTGHLRRADHRAAQRVDQFVANSQHVAKRIARHYGRDAVVVHPPVDLPGAPAAGPRDDFYLCVGYHVPYKRLDLALEACGRLKRRLVIIGEGPDVPRLRVRAGTHVEWLGWRGPEVINDHYRRAVALLFPGEEDFGIVPVEAMVHGCPVIAYGVGGATETVVEGQTGVLFEQQSADALVAAMERAAAATFDPVVMHQRMQRFSQRRFLREMRDLLAGVITPGMKC